MCSQLHSTFSHSVDETVVTSVGYSGDYEDGATRARRTRSRRVKDPSRAPTASETQHNLEMADSVEGTAVNSVSPSEADLRKKFGLSTNFDNSVEQSAGSSTAHASRDTDIECAGLTASNSPEDDTEGDVARYNVTMTRASDDFVPVAPPHGAAFSTNALSVGGTASASNMTRSRSSSICKSTTSTD